jgi:hypothetical protein
MSSPRVSRQPGVRVANRLRGLQRKPFAEAGGFGLYREPGGASSKDIVQRGIDFLPQEARGGIRRAIRFRMRLSEPQMLLPSLPGLELLLNTFPRLTPWAIICRRCSAT